jgi:hypothetical protein
MHYSLTLTGGCHCGNIQLQFVSNKSTHDFLPRACDCSFCRKHGAQYISDPNGALTLHIARDEILARYQQGSHSAEFLCCRECGVLVAVIYNENDRVYGAINTVCLDSPITFSVPQISSPQTLSEAEKIQRWKTLWCSGVILNFD